MKFRLTRHAEEECVRRGIPRRLLEEVMTNPQQVVPERGGRKAYQSMVDFGNGRMMLLRAIVNDAEDPAIVITAYRTSRIEKYWSKS